MIYELRIYSCIPGRLPALLKRFEEHTLKIWAKHGIRQAGFWTVLVGDGNNDLHYLLAWESLAEREKVWETFLADPAWIKARDDSERMARLSPISRARFYGHSVFRGEIGPPSRRLTRPGRASWSPAMNSLTAKPKSVVAVGKVRFGNSCRSP